MLKELYIENLAVIEKADISFCGGLNIFSGETGAGKSILIGGINAVLGGRINKSIVRAGESKATITALFDNIPEETKRRLTENGYDCQDGELLLQRDISADGKSSARICGKLATAAVLKEVASDLIDIHGQNDTRLLMDTDRQREILDSYGGLEGQLEEFKVVFRQFQMVSKNLKQVQSDIQQREIEAAYLSERLNEIESYNFYPGEAEETEKKLETARNFEMIQSALHKAYGMISGDEEGTGALDMIRTADEALEKISAALPDCEPLDKRLKDLLIELQDIGGEIAEKLSDEQGEKPLSFLEERMSDILRITRKYGMELDTLLKEAEGWKTRLAQLQNGDDEVKRLSEEKHRLAEIIKKQALAISEKRKQTAKMLELAITQQLIFLDMPNVRLIYDFTQDKIKASGMDEVQMLISVNKGEEPKPINKIASGGELSRIMLAIKNVLAENDNIPTMIFDEIDTGISGQAAKKVGIKLSEIGEKRQVLCVTHLAQIAARADNHLLIQKASDDTRTYTTVRALDFEQKKHEIARIISGDPDSETALKSAEEMLRGK